MSVASRLSMARPAAPHKTHTLQAGRQQVFDLWHRASGREVSVVTQHRAERLPIHVKNAAPTTGGLILGRVLAAPGLYKYDVITTAGDRVRVDIEQISDYVCPMELEEFETKQFELNLPIQPAQSPEQQYTRMANTSTDSHLHAVEDQSQTDSQEDDDDNEDDDMSLASDEYIVEKILHHALSNPSNHPSQFGLQPVMLYHVKWEGYETTTWEPRHHFPEDLIAEYEKQAGMNR